MGSWSTQSGICGVSWVGPCRHFGFSHSVQHCCYQHPMAESFQHAARIVNELRFFCASRVNELGEHVMLDILNALHGNLLNIGCCNRILFHSSRSLLAHFRCRVCQTAGLLLRAFPRDQRKFRLLSTTKASEVYPWRCYRCGVKQEAENINRRRLSLYDRKCDVCCDFLHASPPPYSYMQNCRRRGNGLYRCNRCLHGAPPKFSLTLRGICFDWKNMLHHSLQSRVLFLVLKTLSAETNPYRRTWKFGCGTS